MSTTSTPEKVKILGPGPARAKLRRIAYEVYEANFGLRELVIVGLNDRGASLAAQLAEVLTDISPIKISPLRARMNDETESVNLLDDNASEVIKGKVVLIVDDVLYSGRTMFHAIASVMEHSPSRVQTAVLIDRGHRNIPVTHDYVGMLLATSLKQHVSVEISPEDHSATAYLL